MEGKQAMEKAASPWGRTYKVKRRWLPWRRTKGGLDGMDSPPDLGDDPLSIILFVVLAVPLIIVLVLFFGELLLLMLLLPVFVLARAVHGEPWTIEVLDRDDVVYTERVKGWNASQERIDQIAKLIRAGIAPPGVGPQVPPGPPMPPGPQVPPGPPMPPGPQVPPGPPMPPGPPVPPAA
ncbi:hypothetical protein [Flexivirga aerilata]|uniref:hypothetical protein n=1 Tax=Flexivirga aerilata TaxID=1656889 RepID=UPI001BB19185|nr:hypothetical protein [Flexivirga aerilata]